jgi:ubiquinone/menaquinone biosynthesis C-methylase UbiE
MDRPPGTYRSSSSRSRASAWNGPTSSREASSAIERALPLLAPEYRGAADDDRDGYLDLLGRDLDQAGAVQGLMRSSVVSSIYERWWRPGFSRLAKGVLGPGMDDERRIARLLLGLRLGDGVLDVACGPGNFSRDFARAVGPEGLVVGIDASRPMLGRAVHETRASRLDNTVFVHGDAAALPFRDASFDAVCCFAALNLMAEPWKALDEMTRVLTPGGRIAIFTSCRIRSRALAGIESALTARSGLRMFDQGEVVQALRERAFEHVSQRISGVTQFVGGRAG